MRIKQFLYAVVFFMLCVFFYFIIVSPNKNNAHYARQIPPFALASLHDEQKTLTEQDLLGRPVLLHTWASWCQICRQESQAWKAIAEEWPGMLVALNYRDDFAAAKNWLQQQGDSFELQLYDPLANLSSRLGVQGTPETFLLDASGNILYHHQGPLTFQVYLNHIKPKLDAA